MTQLAHINAHACIGCSKCLEVCPTDAILGTQKFLHSVIDEDCIGCERCIPVCPVDCIELAPMPTQYDTESLADSAKAARVLYIRNLAQTHKMRLAKKANTARHHFEISKTESEKRRAYLAALFTKNQL